MCHFIGGAWTDKRISVHQAPCPMLGWNNCFIMTVWSHWDTLNLQPLRAILKITFFQIRFAVGVMDLMTTQNHYIHYLLINCGAYLKRVFTSSILYIPPTWVKVKILCTFILGSTWEAQFKQQACEHMKVPNNGDTDKPDAKLKLRYWSK